MSGEHARVRGPSMAAILLHLLPAAALCLLFAAVGIIHVTSRVMVVDAGYRLSRLEQESRALTLANDKIRIELAYLRSPARLEKLAREQLHMALPSPASVITLEKAPVTRPAQKATARRPAGGAR